MSSDQSAPTGVAMIDHEDITQPFAEAWAAAGTHLQDVGNGRFVWLRCNLHQPMAEHLSFRLGNRLFFVFVEALERTGAILAFTDRRAARFLRAAAIAKAVPCRIEVTRVGDRWDVGSPGWGLTHVETGNPVDPTALADDWPVEMTDWELHDFAVQVVKDWLVKEGKEVVEWQSNHEIDPSIWYLDEGRRCYVVVRAVRYPEAEAPRPAILRQLQASFAPFADQGYFASVAAANAQEGAAERAAPLPLLRGCQMVVRFTGLELLE